MSGITPTGHDEPVSSNAEVAMLLREIAQLLKMEGSDPFRQQAYARAADIIERYPRPVSALPSVEAIASIPGVQEPIAERILEYRQYGSIGYLEHLRRLFPAEMRSLMSVPGIGPDMAGKLFRTLHIGSLRELETATRDGRIGAALGDEAEAVVLAGLTQVEHPSDRIPLGQVLAPIRQIVDWLTALPGVSRADVAGAARRWEDTIDRLRFVCAADEPAAVIEAFVDHPLVDRVFEGEADRVLVNLSFGLGAELLAGPASSYGAMLLFATGSAAHVAELQALAGARGLQLDARGLVRLDDGRRLECREEADVYRLLDLAMPPPEMRQGKDELEWARTGQPPVVSPTDLRGDLHVHGAWDDGGGTLTDIAAAAAALGYDYAVVTHHATLNHNRHDTGHFSTALDPDHLERLFALIDRFNASGHGVRLIKGIEVEIGSGGDLLWAPEYGRRAELVVGSISSRERLSGEEHTRRLLRAISTGQIDIVAHPTGRLINQRTPAELDWDALLVAAQGQHVAWEINAHWRRLDLNEDLARQVAQAGGLLSISPDAHHPSQLAGMAFGLAIARRAHVPVSQIVNTWPYERLATWLRRRRQRTA